MNKDLPQIKLEKAEFDFTQVRVQAFWGAILLVGVALVHYISTLNVGFLLDDFLHFNYVSRALAGDTQAFVQNFTGNWAGSDIMKSYRPLVSLSFFTDAWLFGANSVGFHWTNIILFLLCCIFTTLVSLELTGLYGNRLGAVPAIWAGFLFALYPLHPESVAWAIGRVDLLCALFYLASLWSYMRFRLLGERAYLLGALICFWLSFISKEMAVTLPLVISWAELLLYGKNSIARPQTFRQRGFFVLSFWLVLGVLTGIRSWLIGSVVGGYGSAGIMELIMSLRIFIDKASILKLFLPLNEEMTLLPLVTGLNFAGYSIAACLVLLRLVLGSCPWRPFIFLGLSLITMLLPTFQIWHIHPNLVGSRLFFLSSAPWCMLIALSALPAFDKVSKKLALVLTCIGLTALSLLTVSWSFMLDSNLKPWIQAGDELRTLHTQVLEHTRKGSMPLLINLPQDIHGAGMLTRPLYLSYLLTPPLSPEKTELKFFTIEPAISGSHDFLWPGRLQQLAVESRDKLIWSRAEGKFVPWLQAPKGDLNLVQLFPAKDSMSAFSRISPAQTVVSPDKWHFAYSLAPSIIQSKEQCRLYPSKDGLSLDFNLPKNIDPLTLGMLKIKMKLVGSNGCTSCLADKVKFSWSGPMGSESSVKTVASVINKVDGVYTVWLGRYRQWSLLKSIDTLSINLAPGDYYVYLDSVVLDSSSTTVPNFTAELERDGLNLSFDASSLSNADKTNADKTNAEKTNAEKTSSVNIRKSGFVRILGSQLNNTFDANSEAELNSISPATTKLGFEQEVRALKGSILISREQLNQMANGKPGIIQFRAVTADTAGQPLGLPSEPVSLRFNDKGSMEIIR